MAIFSGDIFAEQYVISSSVTEVTIGSVSGSTAFGDTQDDTHQFTGSLSVSGSLTSEGLKSIGTAPHITFEETDQNGIAHKLSMQVNTRALSWNSIGDGGFVSTDFQMHRTGAGAYFHRWFIAGSEKFRVHNNGYLGIGNPAPSYAVDILVNSDYHFRAGRSGAKYVAIEDDVIRFIGMVGNGMRITTNDNAAVKYGIGTGDFHWHNNDSVIMSLTYGGNLGLGITNPSQRLNVQGISTFSDDAFFSSDVFISGNLTISSLNVSSINANLFGNVTGDVVSSGISTFNDVSIGNTAFVESQAIVGTGITVPSHIPFAVNPGEGQFFVDDTSSVGIGTNIIGDEFVLDVYGGISGTQVSVGTTIPQASVDFSNAGIGTNIGFMIPPKVSDAERVGLVTVTGAFIYNTTSNKLQVYTGSSWETITSA